MDGVRCLAYSTARHPWTAWLRSVASELETAIDRIPPDGSEALSRRLSDETMRGPFRRLQHRFVREVIQPHAPHVEHVQAGAYVRLHRAGPGTPFHTDREVGHGEEELNVWIPLGPARLWVEPAKRPFCLDVGEALLFRSTDRHGVLPGCSQTSLDFRVTPRVNPYAILGCRFIPLLAVEQLAG